jgi:hypothetical protein
MIAELQRATQAIQPYVDAGDYGGARAKLEETALTMPDVQAARQERPSPARQSAARGAASALSFVSQPFQPTPTKPKQGGVIGALDRITPEFVEPAIKGATTALDAGRKYVGAPLASVVTGVTGQETQVDPKTGQTYRSKPGFKDVGRSLAEAFTRSPVETYKEARTASDERLRDPNLSAGERFLLQAAYDPLNFVGIGAAKHASRLLPAAVRSSKAGIIAGPIARSFEVPGTAVAGATVGGALASEAADRMGFDSAGAQLLAAGIGGVAGAKVAGRVGRTAPRLGMVAEEAPKRPIPPQDPGLPDYSKASIFDLPKLERKPLSVMDKAYNSVAKTIFREPILREETVYPIFKAREQLKPIVESQAARAGIAVEDVARKAFERDNLGRITTIPGNPTVSGLAAAYERMSPFLTTEQRQAMEYIRAELAPFKAKLDEAGVVIHNRPDIEPGGFYIPRGSAEIEGMDLPRAYGGGRPGSRTGPLAHAKFKTQEEAFAKGYEYASLQEAVESMARITGRHAIDNHIREYLKGVTLDDFPEVRVASTPADRMPNNIRAHWQDLTAELGKVKSRLATAEKRARIAISKEDELDKAVAEFDRGIPDEGTRGVARVGTRVQQEAARGERMAAQGEKLAGDKSRRKMTAGGPIRTSQPATEAERLRARFYEARAEEIQRVTDKVGELIPPDVDRLRFLETAMNRTQRRINVLRQRGGKYNIAADSLQREIEHIQERIKEFRPTYKAALEQSHKVGRGEGIIQMAGLEQYGFPAEMANVANKFLNAEKPASGKGAQLIEAANAFNTLSRGLRATLDVSFMGIQGAIGLARNPVAYAKALKVAFQSMADETVLGSYIKQFDEKALRAGRPTSREWAARGLHIGGTQTEFTIGSGLGKIGDALQYGGKVNPIRGSNRAFGNFGDALRLELANTAYGSSKFFGFNMQDPKNLESVASAVDRATGWSPNRFAGDAGEMALFAPRFFQSQLEFLTQAAAGGGPGAWEARRMLAQFVGLGVMTTVMANVAQEDGIPLEQVFDPMSSNFMRFRVKGQDVSIFGPWDSLARGIVNTVKDDGDPRAFYRSKASPLVGTAWTLLSGQNFRGENRSVGSVLRELVAPFSVSDSVLLGGDKGPIPTGLGLTGIKASAMTPTEQLDALARAKYNESFYDLDPSQKKAMKEAHPELWERAVSRKDQAGQQWEEVKAQYVSDQRQRDNDLLSGKITVEQWRDARSNEIAERSGQFQAIFKDKHFENRANPILQGYFDALDKADNHGVFNYDVVESYLATLDDAGRKYIADNVGVDATPLEKLRKKLAAEYYDIPQYRGYDADTGHEINNLFQVVANTATSGSDAAKLRALRQIAASGQWSEQAVRGVRRSILGLLRESRGRGQYARSHPEIAILTGRGPLTPEMAASIRRVLPDNS